MRNFTDAVDSKNTFNQNTPLTFSKSREVISVIIMLPTTWHRSQGKPKIKTSVLWQILCCYAISLSHAFHTGRYHHNHNLIQRNRVVVTSLASTAPKALDCHEWVEVSGSSPQPKFDDFDYLDYWHPVAFAQDLPFDRPVKVSIFDVDYVVARISEKGGKNPNSPKSNDFSSLDYQKVIALVDKCPHKLAALSEGRITKCGDVQCAYHGWTFAGDDGKCIEIPQLVSENVSLSERGISASVGSMKSHATAIPALISQGILWLFPGGAERALLAPEPPRIPEIDEGYRVTPVVRDFPIDWTLLIENIMDPDHGLFAHSAKGFDLYSASPSSPQTVVEEVRTNGKGWRATSSVDAVNKLVDANNAWKSEVKEKGQADSEKTDENSDTSKDRLRSTTTFVAPNLIYSCRRDPETQNTSFMTAFWVCPTGVGRSRFMSAAIGKIPFPVPRFLAHMSINNFLDQDSYLLYTQQNHVLAREAQLNESNDNKKLRKGSFVYRSPTEKLQVRIAAFFDSTLSRVPNRAKLLKGNNEFRKAREFVLDRFEQHTKICPDSLKLYTNCSRLIRLSSFLSLFSVVSFLFEKTSMSFVFKLFSRRMLRSLLLVSGLVALMSNKIKKEFEFKYTEKYRNKDLDNIPGVWMDMTKH